ncbi:MAG TPA: DoxX family protein [Candidatus Rubrimentiphilum sp.]|nr:DoxX family protein [Candidatus Rubrimentiphilum sp.]
MFIALLLARLIFGLGLAAHGAQKLFGWFGGYGPKGTGDFFESMGWRPGVLFAVAAGLGEVGGGLLLALGLLGGIGPAIIIIVMLTAILTSHIGKGFFAPTGWELPGVYIAGALAIDFAGFGIYSVDNAVGLTIVATENLRWIAIGVAVVLALLSAGARLLPQPASANAAK